MGRWVVWTWLLGRGASQLGPPWTISIGPTGPLLAAPDLAESVPRGARTCSLSLGLTLAHQLLVQLLDPSGSSSKAVK